MIFVIYIAASITDLRSRQIPNFLPVLLALSGFLHALRVQIPLYMPALNGALGLFFFLALSLFGDYLLRCKGKEGCSLGGGDVKLLAATACRLGFQPALFILFISQLLLLAWAGVQKLRGKPEDTAFPLAPFLLAGLVVLYCLKQQSMTQ